MVSKKPSHCEVQRGEVDLAAYASLDGVWRRLGLAAPARRALIDVGLMELSQLSTWTRADIASLHGMGPNALKKIDEALTKDELSYKV